MEKVYYKNKKSFFRDVRNQKALLTIVTCACGETPGAIINDKVLLLCKNCYEKAAIVQRGE